MAAAELAATFGDAPLFWCRAKVFIADLLAARGFEAIAGSLCYLGQPLQVRVLSVLIGAAAAARGRTPTECRSITTTTPRYPCRLLG